MILGISTGVVLAAVECGRISAELESIREIDGKVKSLGTDLEQDYEEVVQEWRGVKE